MRRQKNSTFPDPPDLPSFTIEEDPEATHKGPEQAPPAAFERHANTGLRRHDVTLDEARIDADAAKIVRRLERAGFQAYLVGGCVRDLLLGGKPKDFDIATSARPEDVRAIFRNCRIIGRRFRLAHVFFSGGKVIEVATFRQKPVAEMLEDELAAAPEAIDDLLIRSDNVFGEAHEDALRRDFTINALFYDLDRQQVLDWCGGMADISRRAIHTIGEPAIRFREDPVRILRAIKFAARLDLGITPDVVDAMVAYRDELAKAARPRVFEEILRLLRAGAARRSMWLLWESGAMAVLLPELAAFLDDHEGTDGGANRFWQKLRAIDEKTARQGTPLDDIVLFSTLLHEPILEACAEEDDKIAAAYEFLEPIVERIAVPRRISDIMRRIIAIQPRLEAGRPGRFARTELISPALDIFELDLISRERSTAFVDEMRARVIEENGGSFPTRSPRPVRASRRRRHHT